MTRILQNLRKRAIGMLNGGMTMNAVAITIGCFTCAIRHLRPLYSEHPPAQLLSNCHSYFW